MATVALKAVTVASINVEIGISFLHSMSTLDPFRLLHADNRNENFVAGKLVKGKMVLVELATLVAGPAILSAYK